MSKKIDDSWISSIIYLSNLFRVSLFLFCLTILITSSLRWAWWIIFFLPINNFILIRNMNGIRGASGSARSRGKNSATLILTSGIVTSLGRFFSESERRVISPIAISDVQNGAFRHASHSKPRWKPIRVSSCTASYSRSRYVYVCASLTNRHADRDVNY